MSKNYVGCGLRRDHHHNGLKIVIVKELRLLLIPCKGVQNPKPSIGEVLSESRLKNGSTPNFLLLSSLFMASSSS